MPASTIRGKPNYSAVNVQDMQRSTLPDPVTDLPPEQVATSANPARAYSAMKARGLHRRGDAWVIARTHEVTAALSSSALSVAPPGRPNGHAELLQARMARFSDGLDHVRRRSLVEKLLSDVARAGQAAAVQTHEHIRNRTGSFDVMPLARSVPVAVLAEALGVAHADVERVVRSTGQLCEAFAPSLGPRSVDDDIDLVAENLTRLLRRRGRSDAEHVAAAAGVLFQARDATAALIGATLLEAKRVPFGQIDQWIETALRQDAPVQCTRRMAVAELVLGDHKVPKGAEVWLMLAAAEPDSGDAPDTFGAGPHRCPGSSLAGELARGFVSAVTGDGWRPVPEQPETYERRPNLRLPSRIMVQRS